MAWMKKTITIPADWDGQQIKLYFEAVSGYTEIYINKEKVGENFDIFLPFSVDITDKVNAGETAEVWVGVRSQSLFETILRLVAALFLQVLCGDIILPVSGRMYICWHCPKCMWKMYM